MVWCIFDSGITLSIVFGLPYVASGEMTSAALIDNFIKLNFHINFSLREVLEKIPRSSLAKWDVPYLADGTEVLAPAAAPSVSSARGRRHARYR